MFATLYNDFFLSAYPWLRILIWAVLWGGLGVLLSWGFFQLISRYYLKPSKAYITRSLRKHLGGRVRTLFPMLGIYFTRHFLLLDPDLLNVLTDVLQVLIILNLGWIATQLLNVLEDIFFEEYKIKQNKYLKERRIRTQIQFLKKIVFIIIGILALSAILLSFEKVQQFGTTLLTSTAVIGVIVGVASQKTISNLISGFQIAFTQPIKIDDTVIVEGEWGVVEEITLTYVVVQIWDKRRMVLPINYFVDTPFQNWTRNTEDLIGEVQIHTDYRLPVATVRKELADYLQVHSLWDGEEAGLQVTDSNEKSMLVRATMSAHDPEKCWQLKCDVREHLIGFIQQHYPECLPRWRYEEEGGAGERGL